MASVKIADVINKVELILQDDTNVRWTAAELLGWANDSYREIVLARPDVNTLSGTFTCVEGTRQVLTAGFSSALRLIDVVCNKAVSSTKGAVRLISRKILDDQRRNWHDLAAKSVDIEYFMFDPRLPKEFQVYPPATTAAQLEVLYASVPTGHTVSGQAVPDEVIKIDDSYANCMVDYVLYRAYSKDAEYAANSQRAMAHLQAMQASLGVKTQADQAVIPQENAPRPPTTARGM
jgi:hypothetical protein